MTDAAPQLSVVVRVSDRAADITLSCVIGFGVLAVLVCCCCLGGFISAVFNDGTARCVKIGLVTSLPVVSRASTLLVSTLPLRHGPTFQPFLAGFGLHCASVLQAVKKCGHNVAQSP